MRRASLALAAVLALLPALSGCGESEEEAFADDFRPLNQRIVDLGGQVDDAVKEAAGKSNEELAAEFSRLAQRTDDAAKDVDALEPPDDLQKPKDDLVKAMGDAGEALSDIETAAGDNDPEDARRATLDLVSSSEAIGKARRELEQATRSEG